MLEFLHGGGQVSDRQWRLFAVGGCRQVWHHITSDVARHAVEVAERFADGLASQEELAAAWWSFEGLPGHLTDQAVNAAEKATACPTAVSRHLGSRLPADLVRQIVIGHLTSCVISATAEAVSQPAGNAARNAAGGVAAGMRAVRARDEAKAAVQKGHKARHCDLLRDVIGNPFRPLPPIPAAVLAWNDRCVVKLAARIYEERDFSPASLGVLGEALEEAGLTDGEVLSHLRGPGPHVLGCWATDLLLAKS
jgi:hypothetical protein